MKITLGEVDTAKDSLRSLMAKELPIKVSYRFAKLAKQLSDELNQLEDQRKELIKKHGDAKDDGTFKIPDDKRETFLKEYEDLLSLEIDVNFEPVTVDQLGDINISSAQLVNLHRFIELD